MDKRSNIKFEFCVPVSNPAVADFGFSITIVLMVLCILHLHVVIHFSGIPECKLTHEICLMALRCIPLFLRDTDRDVYFYFAGRLRSFRFTDQNRFRVSFQQTFMTRRAFTRGRESTWTVGNGVKSSKL